jgi:hypothetical protein
MPMNYEIRKWSDDLDCLYTDDCRVKDIAVKSGELRIVSSYFRTSREAQPFAWDIVGPRTSLAPIAGRFRRLAGTGAHRRTT